MNNVCPSCGTTYSLNPNDVGRKVRCKRCGVTLLITPEGLALEGAGTAAPTSPASAPVPPAPLPSAPGEGYMEVPRLPMVRAQTQPGLPTQFSLATIGGIPTVLFALGVFLVIWFSYMVPIGDAAAQRAQARVNMLKLEQQIEIQRLQSKGGKGEEMENIKKIVEKYQPKVQEAENDAEYSRISSLRSRWLDLYGQLVGFVLLAFGCIGYLRTEQPLVLRIVAAVILSFMLMVMFIFGVGGCNADRTPIPLPKGKANIFPND